MTQGPEADSHARAPPPSNRIHDPPPPRTLRSICTTATQRTNELGNDSPARHDPRDTERPKRTVQSTRNTCAPYTRNDRPTPRTSNQYIGRPSSSDRPKNFRPIYGAHVRLVQPNTKPTPSSSNQYKPKTKTHSHLKKPISKLRATLSHNLRSPNRRRLNVA